LPQQDNLLVAALPRADRTRLLDGCEPVELVLSEILCEAGEPTRHVYFPANSFVSLIAQVDNGHGLEVGMAGREGMLGVHLALGVSREPLKALVQGAGVAWRMAAAPFSAELARSTPLRELLHRYLYVLMVQRAASEACLRFHEIGPRLARWLLMSQDRARVDSFPMTQEFLATMLGVRRVGITAAAGELSRRGLITYHRGELTVLDRAGLQSAACGCYAADLASYRQTMKTRR
jgi:CRP-like cAMP-binding protein